MRLQQPIKMMDDTLIVNLRSSGSAQCTLQQTAKQLPKQTASWDGWHEEAGRQGDRHVRSAQKIKNKLKINKQQSTHVNEFEMKFEFAMHANLYRANRIDRRRDFLGYVLRMAIRMSHNLFFFFLWQGIFCLFTVSWVTHMPRGVDSVTISHFAAFPFATVAILLLLCNEIESFCAHSYSICIQMCMQITHT